MREGMEKQLAEMFPDHDATLVLTGFVFRPSDASDEPDEGEEDSEETPPWTLELHFTAPKHGLVNNTTTKLGLLYEAETYEGACAQFIASVNGSSPDAGTEAYQTTDQLFSDKSEWGSFHDVVYEVTGNSMSPEELRKVFYTLPGNIRNKAHEWGLSDTVFRDDASVFLRS
jgi:hypothetical protein